MMTPAAVAVLVAADSLAMAADALGKCNSLPSLRIREQHVKGCARCQVKAALEVYRKARQTYHETQDSN